MIEVDVWLRGTQHATTHPITSLPADPQAWEEDDVKRLLSEMLLALDREKNPGGEAPTVTLRGFNWIVSPYEGGVLLHVEVQTGTVSAGPLAIDEARLTQFVTRVLASPQAPPAPASPSIH
jgi:hypothetical protein